MEEILPHASADTSNTDSNRNEGALYSFFCFEAATPLASGLLGLSFSNCYAPCQHSNPICHICIKQLAVMAEVGCG